MLQQKIVTTLMLLLLIFSSPYLVMSEETNVTCVAPSVKEGQPGQLTCNFNLDLSKLEDYIATVEFYRPGKNDPIEIIECHLAQGSKGCNEVEEGYTFNQTIDTHLRLDITDVSSSNVGSYVCKLLSTKIKADPVPCSFNIADVVPLDPKTTPSATTPGENVTIQAVQESESGFPYIPVAVGVVAVGVVMVVVVITIIICRRRTTQRSRSDDDAENQKLADSKSAVNTTGKSVSEDDDPPAIPERAPILQDKLYADPWRGEDGDEHFTNSEVFPATDTEPPQKPPRLYELLSQETHEGDAKAMSAPEKEETDVAKELLLKEDAVSEHVETTKPPSSP